MLLKDPNSLSPASGESSPASPCQLPHTVTAPSAPTPSEGDDRSPLRVRDLVQSTEIDEPLSTMSPNSRLGMALMRIGGWKPSAPQVIARLETEVRAQTDRAVAFEKQLRTTTDALGQTRDELEAQRAACVEHTAVLLEREQDLCRLQRELTDLETAQQNLVEQITLLEAQLYAQAREDVPGRPLSLRARPQLAIARRRRS